MAWNLRVMNYLRLAISGTFLKISRVVVCNFSRMSMTRRSFTFGVGSEIMFP
jgi:hypothetical protein